MRRHRRPRVICNGIAAAAIVVIKALRTTGIVTLNYQYRLIEEEIGKGEREGGERERPDAGESWFDGEEAEDEE